jgi:hypothetical protein
LGRFANAVSVGEAGLDVPLTWLQGMEVVRRLYAAVGFGPLVFIADASLLTAAREWNMKIAIIGPGISGLLAAGPRQAGPPCPRSDAGRLVD